MSTHDWKLLQKLEAESAKRFSRRVRLTLPQLDANRERSTATRRNRGGFRRNGPYDHSDTAQSAGSAQSRTSEAGAVGRVLTAARRDGLATWWSQPGLMRIHPASVIFVWSRLLSVGQFDPGSSGG